MDRSELANLLCILEEHGVDGLPGEWDKILMVRGLTPEGKKASIDEFLAALKSRMSLEAYVRLFTFCAEQPDLFTAPSTRRGSPSDASEPIVQGPLADSSSPAAMGAGLQLPQDPMPPAGLSNVTPMQQDQGQQREQQEQEGQQHHEQPELGQQLQAEEQQVYPMDDPEPPQHDRQVEGQIPPTSSRKLARDFIMEKFQVFQLESDEWDWFKPERHDSYLLKNYLLVVDAHGYIIEEAWDPSQEVNIQSKQYSDYITCGRERPMLNNEYISLFGTSSPTTADRLQKLCHGVECSHPVWTVQSIQTDGITLNMGLRLMVLCLEESWRQMGPSNNSTGGEWPASLQGLQGLSMYLKFRPQKKSCYYYGRNYGHESMWPAKPPPPVIDLEGGRPKRQRRSILGSMLDDIENEETAGEFEEVKEEETEVEIKEEESGLIGPY